jgi:hypothetical protein
MIVRKLLGRKQRTELPPPPTDVQRRAETSRLPSDFFVAATPTAPAQLPPASTPPAQQPEIPPRSNGHA